MTTEELDTVENLAKILGNAAALVDILSRLLLQIVDGGARALLDQESAAEVDSVLADAGVQAERFRGVVRVTREAVAKGRIYG